jgi:membrane-associated phospholipid phosphatase
MKLWRQRIALIMLIAFSRLYLGTHWLSDVGATLAFGTIWIAALAIFYLGQKDRSCQARSRPTSLSSLPPWLDPGTQVERTFPIWIATHHAP